MNRSIDIQPQNALAGGGEMGGRIRAFDWAATPLGPINAWPSALGTAVDICINSRFPMFVGWGAAAIMFYNDAYRPVLGNKHPAALGEPAERVWREIWDVIGPMAESVLASGEPIWSEDLLLMMDRNLPQEETFFTFSYSPIIANGRVGGIYCACTETTARVVGERRMRTLVNLGMQAPQAKTAQDACKTALGIMGGDTADIPFAAAYLFDDANEVATLAATAGLAADDVRCPPQLRVTPDDAPLWPLAELVARREAMLSKNPPLADAAQVLLLPIPALGSPALAGVLIAGLSPHRVIDDAYRSFFDLVAGYIATAFDNARAHEAERRRAESITCVDDCIAAQVALRASEERFRTLAETVPALVWTRRADGRLDYVNAAWRDFSGMALEEAQRQSTTDTLHPDDRAMACAVWEEARRTGSSYELEARFRRIDGEYRWLSIRASPLIDQSGAIIGRCGIATDIQDKRMENQALQLADRRKDEFVAMLAHELRNPLAPIRNAVEILRVADQHSSQTDPFNTKTAWAREVIERQMRHITRLVDDLLDVSRITRNKVRLQLQPLDLKQVVQQAVETSMPFFEERRQRLTTRLTHAPLNLRGDPARLTQVLTNLLNNAAKFSHDEGTVELTAVRQNDEAIVRVKDYGIGIADNLLPHVFTLFTQADLTLDRAQSGLGIGLTIVRRLVLMHGGAIEAASAGAGEGAEFTLRLPLCDTVPEGPESTPQSAGSQKQRRVLVVDDNVDSAESLAMMLQLDGHVVATAHDGEAAIALTASFDPDVVLLDIGLPKRNGYQVAEALRATPKTRPLTLIALTGYGQAEDRRRTKEAGFDFHEVKPIAPARLSELLELTR